MMKLILKTARINIISLLFLLPSQSVTNLKISYEQLLEEKLDALSSELRDFKERATENHKLIEQRLELQQKELDNQKIQLDNQTCRVQNIEQNVVSWVKSPPFYH